MIADTRSVEESPSFDLSSHQLLWELIRAEMAKWAKEELAAYRRPKRWLVVEELPRGSTRKVDKKALVKEFEEAS